MNNREFLLNMIRQMVDEEGHELDERSHNADHLVRMLQQTMAESGWGGMSIDDLFDEEEEKPKKKMSKQDKYLDRLGVETE